MDYSKHANSKKPRHSYCAKMIEFRGSSRNCKGRLNIPLLLEEAVDRVGEPVAREEVVALGVARGEVVVRSPVEAAMVGKARDDVDRLVVEEEEEEEGAEEVKGGVSGKDLLEAEVDARRLEEETGVEEAGASDVLDVPDDEAGLSEVLSEVDSMVELGVEEVS